MTTDSALYPTERLARVADAVRAGRPRRPAAHPGPRPALRDRLRRQAAGAADLPGGARRRRPVPGGAAARAEGGAGLAGRRARPGDGDVGGDRAPVRDDHGQGRRPAVRRACPTGCGRCTCCSSRTPSPTAEPAAGEHGAVAAADAQVGRRGRARCSEAGEAIDRVHANVPGWLRPGLTERQVGAKIAEAILAEGHVQVDFVIVGSGPNAASPHHEVSDRVIEDGDVVVVDIGGTMPSGYCSDCTRTYAVGHAPDDFMEYYEVLKRAQEAATRQRPARRHRRERRPDGPRDHRRRRVRRVVHPPHRPRHRPGVPRGPVHRRGQRHPARAGHGLLHRARHLPGPARRAHRGHRGLHRPGRPTGPATSG